MWILIILSIAGTTGKAVHSIEFESKQTCEAAKKACDVSSIYDFVCVKK